MTTKYDFSTGLARIARDANGRAIALDDARSTDAHQYFDGLGRPVRSLGYDGRNLRTVTQGAQARSFTYDSLSRLTSATIPESGTTRYKYDANGNLVLKIDPRQRTGTLTLPDCAAPYAGSQVAVCYAYDSLNRIQSRTYNDGTPNVSYTYDDASAANSKGRLTKVSSSASVYRYTAYDAAGRVTGSSQATDGVTYAMAYGYDLASNLTSEQYPSGRVVRTEYDDAGRVAGAKDQAAGFYYAGGAPSDANNRIRYAPHGAVEPLRLGNGLWEHASFNSRLQTEQIGLGASPITSGVLKLGYGSVVNGVLDPTKNNGNPRSRTITTPGAPASFVQTYDYDELNRLEPAEEKVGSSSNWKQVFVYDCYGNRNFAAGTMSPDYSQAALDPATGLPQDPAGNPVIDPSNNRVKTSAPGQSAYQYDAAGELLCDAAHPCGSGQTASMPYYSYDADGRLEAAGGGYAAGGPSYTYDGDGRRVKKAVYVGEATVFVYDASGRAAEYSN
jgi:YD repeat-containing protein